MKIDIRSHRIALTEELRAYIERRLQFALGRFEKHVIAVTMTLEDLNGPRGGVDKQCRITAVLSAAGYPRVEVKSSDITSAVDHATDRIRYLVARELERQHGYPRHRPAITRIAGETLFRRSSRRPDYPRVA